MPLRQSKNRQLLQNPRLVEHADVEKDICRNELHSSRGLVWESESFEACERIYECYVRCENGERIPQCAFCDIPKWVFAEYAIQFRSACLFGDPRSNNARLRPTRPSLNLIGFNRPALILHASAVEAFFHAVVDDDKLRELDCPMRTTITLPTAKDCSEQRFYFGLDYRSTSFAPWRPGFVYLYARKDLPTDYPFRPFETQAPIRPLASFGVFPTDWPMLDKVDAVDVISINERCNETYRGFPWRNCDEVHPRRWRRAVMEPVRREIEKNASQSLSLEYLGRLAGCSPFALLRMFCAEFGVSPRAYQNQMRVDRGKSLLVKGLPIGDVAMEIGFYDQSHFTRAFRQAIGMTPAQYVQTQDSPRLGGIRGLNIAL